MIIYHEWESSVFPRESPEDPLSIIIGREKIPYKGAIRIPIEIMLENPEDPLLYLVNVGIVILGNGCVTIVGGTQEATNELAALLFSEQSRKEEISP